MRRLLLQAGGSWTFAMCDCLQQTDGEIIRQLQAGTIPVAAFQRNCCWDRIRQVRAAYSRDISAAAWRATWDAACRVRPRGSLFARS